MFQILTHLCFLAFDFETCFASHSVPNVLRRVIAQQALLRLQDISAHCSDSEYSDSELDGALTNDAQAEVDLSGKESDVDSPSEDDDSDLQNQVQVNQDLIGKDGTAKQDRKRRNSLAISQVQRGHLQEQNILSFKPGPTTFATSRITESSTPSWCWLWFYPTHS